MTTRDYYAAAALQGVLVNERSELTKNGLSLAVDTATSVADKMIKAACKAWGHDVDLGGDCQRCGDKGEPGR